MTHKKSILFPLLLVLYEIATYLSNDMYLPALPDMMKDLSLTPQVAQSTLTTWFVGTAILPLLMGILSDQYGRRSVLLIGGVFYILATIMCALATNSSSLLIFRFIQGASIPSMMVAGYACVHELYDQKEAIRILALMSSITILAPALGPLLGSILLFFTSWRGIFWFIAILSTLAIAALFKWMPETYSPEKRVPLDLVTLFKQYGRILINPRFMLLLCVLGFIFAGFIVWIAAGSLLVIQNFKYSPFAFGIIQALIFATYIYGNHQVKYLLEWMNINKLIWLGLAITLLGGMLILMFAMFSPNNLILFLIAMAIYSLGSALCFAPLNRMIIEASDEPMSLRVGLFTVLWTAFGVLGSLIASFYFDGTIRSIAYPITDTIIISCLLMAVAGKINTKPTVDKL